MIDSADQQARIISISGVPPSVAVALDCWAAWMRKGNYGIGYPKKSVGFVTGGINCFDDMGDEAENHLAISADGAIKGLGFTPRTCIGIVWLGHKIIYRRADIIDVDAIAAEAVRQIHRGLMIRGAV